VDARLPPPPTTERVTAASEPDPHDGILAHPARTEQPPSTNSGMCIVQPRLAPIMARQIDLFCTPQSAKAVRNAAAPNG
jgi:hypothetical protein